jgi:NADP-dependent 3-hydroxy acid dehydrogenase YdfG/acyl carrier protein
MIQHRWQQQLTFALVSQNAQQVHAGDSIDIWQHHLWSMTRIFAAEQPSYQAVLVDVDAQESLVQNAKIIVTELAQYQARQNHIAYRVRERYTIRFTPELSSTKNNSSSPWIAPVAALITGGLGALGYEVAEFLVSQGTRFVLLTGTTVLSSQTTEKNTWLKQLEAKGIQAIYAAVDAANQEKMAQLIKEVEQAWNQPIDGVFHLAGVTTDNITIAEMDEILWRNVLDVKVKGALVLHELFKQSPLSCFVLFSSIAAVPHFGMAGLSAYAVANEFISGLALYRRSQNLPAVSMNWIAWSEKGMSHRHNHDAFLDAVGMASLNIKAGITVLEAVLRLNPAEITICKMQWKKFFQVNATVKQLDFFTHFIAEHVPTSQSAVGSSWSQEQIATLVSTLFASSLALEVDEIDQETPLQHYGMDSIIGINFTAELGKHFPDAIAPMDLYRYPTLKQLTDYIIQWAHLPLSEPELIAVIDATEALDIDQLSYEQLNELIEAELKDLELTYD